MSSNASKTLVVAKHCPKELQPDSAGWCLNDFVLVKKLGVGGASAVYQAIHRRSRACVALKLYFKSKLTALNTHQVQREVAIHSGLNHPSIISLVCICHIIPLALLCCFKTQLLIQLAVLHAVLP
jgi:serine/threonine protein kinase